MQEIVIKIPKEMWEWINDANKFYEDYGISDFVGFIKNGTPLPKRHGKLKDFDKIEWYGCTTELNCPYKDRECKDCHRAECSKTQVDDIPTIIEADRSEE